MSQRTVRSGVLVIVQNLPVPLDRRVWQECRALIDDGVHVSVICPKGPGDPRRQTIDGVLIYKYRPAPQARGAVGFAFEFAYSWLRTAWLSVVARRHNRFAVIQACNPPDTYWLLALLWRSRGVRFVFDQHDLNPELFLSRFGEPRGFASRMQYRMLVTLERMTYRAAHHVIATNDSYKRIAMERGHRSAADVTVVRSGPDTSRMRPVYPSDDLRHGATHLLAYIGIMGPQDGVDGILDVMHTLVHERGRTDIRAALLGFGDCLVDLRHRSSELDLDNHVEFTGRVGLPEIMQYLSTADVGLCPDLKTPLNDLSTMNKTMEYMSYCLPSVSFDLHETRVSAGPTALYVESGDIAAFADAIERLLDDDELRTDMGIAARDRVVAQFDWREQAKKYVGVYRDLLGRGQGDVELPESVYSNRDETGSLVPLEEPAALRAYVRSRSRPAVTE